MKYSTTSEFIKAAKASELQGVIVTVDNDKVFAYQGGEKVFDFNAGPQEALIDVLSALGVDAEYP